MNARRSRRTRAQRADGSTLVEMLISMAIMTVVTGAIVRMAAGSQSGFRMQPEFADMQQRLRVAADYLSRDLMMAGAGPPTRVGDSLVRYLPPVVPARRGSLGPDPDLFFASDRITIVYAARSRAHASLASDMPSNLAPIAVDGAPPCPAATPCGFRNGMRALVFDASGAGHGFDLFTVTNTAASMLEHGAANTPLSKAYSRSSARVLEVEQHVYFHDAPTRRLMHYDGYLGLFPVVDNVVSLRFSYYADPDATGAPRPRPPGGNCVYAAGDPPVPLLASLGGTALRELRPAQLTDGPVCGLAPNRFDGDLLRVRKVRVQIAVGPAGEGVRAGEYAVAFDVTPRNMNLLR